MSSSKTYKRLLLVGFSLFDFAFIILIAANVFNIVKEFIRPEKDVNLFKSYGIQICNKPESSGVL